MLIERSEADSDEQPAKPPPRRRVDRGVLVASLVISAGLVLIGWGLVVAVTGDEGRELPDAIESVSPPVDAQQVPAQTRIVIDLANGYEATLRIDDVDIPVIRSDDLANNAELEPGDQVTLPPAAVYEPGNATITFVPSEDAPIDSLERGEHQVSIIYWRSVDGPETARSFHWTFEVL